MRGVKLTSTRSLPSRLAVLSITCILIICIFSCEKDPISSTLPEDTYTLAETKMLGSDGGEIVADELTLTVPPLAFNSSTEIKIYSSTIDKPFEEDHLSKSYRIEGLPFDSDVPLKISIKYSNSSSGDNSLAMGEETLSGEYSYRFLESIDSNGYVTGEIPVPDRDLGKISLKKIDGDGKFILTVAIISGYTSYLSAQGHCLITLPLAHTNNINNLAEFLEEAYQKYLDMGFSYGKRTNCGWDCVSF